MQPHSVAPEVCAPQIAAETNGAFRLNLGAIWAAAKI